jgi:HlyD family secretion protein
MNSMDIARPDISRTKRRKRVWFGAGVVAALALATLAFSRLEPAAPTVAQAAIWTDTVKRGSMLREVRGSGALVPEELRWVTATSPGHIEHIPLLAGVAVAPDTVLLELSNPELEQAALDAEAQVRAGQARAESLIVKLENDRLTQDSALAALRSQLALARIEAEVDEELQKRRFIAGATVMRSRAVVEDLEARCRLLEKQLAIGEKSAAAQLVAQEAELENLRRQLAFKQRQLEALTVRAGMVGVLQQLGDDRPLRVGQQLSAGATVGRIADPQRLKAEIKISQTQAGEVQHGQPVIIDTRNGLIAGRVSRIDPSVQNGTVTVDVTLDAPLPPGARPDLRVDGVITIEKLDDVLHVGRPIHGQTESRIHLFKIEKGGRSALRVPVELGRISVSVIEVKEGLRAGDQVVLSDMSKWERYDRIKLN